MEKEITCLMCNNRNYTWYEVLRDTCGIKEPVQAIAELCDIHRQIAYEQLEEKARKIR